MRGGLQWKAGKVGGTRRHEVDGGECMDAMSAAGLGGCVTNAVGALSGVSVMPSYVASSRVNDLTMYMQIQLL